MRPEYKSRLRRGFCWQVRFCLHISLAKRAEDRPAVFDASAHYRADGMG